MQFHPPSSDLDHETLGLFPNDNPHEIHDEIITDHNFSNIINPENNGITLEAADTNSADGFNEPVSQFKFQVNV